ncbi:MAG: sugar ABC transporter ATP-binding protein [Rectinemataceae bacterium]|jgi:ribose transport system ATP-binding protein
MSNADRVPLVQMRAIVKRFPGVLALDRVDFDLLPGEVHMLLGENGAGKSTLIKVLSGAYTRDSGDIFVHGGRVDIRSPMDPPKLGLRFIYQELNLVPQLDVARNMFLGDEPRTLGFVRQRELYDTAARCLENFHINLDPRAIVGRLSVTQQKLVEIARALHKDAQVLVMDEPTDVLEDQSRQDLFGVINDLKKSHGVGFVYISHRYSEVHQLGDRVTILRDGRNVGTFNTSDITLDQIIEKMVGRKIEAQYPRLSGTVGVEEALRVEGIRQKKKLKGISLTVRKGEIVSVTGLMGAGKTELGRAICGIDPCDAGEVYVEGRMIRFSSPETAIQAGLAYLTEDRKVLGLIQAHSISSNYGLPSSRRLSRFGFIDHKAIHREADEFMQKLNIKAPNRETRAGQLSGGNQQKVVVAKWLGVRSKVLVFDEPTRGIDIRGRAEVYALMKELLDQGIGILMLTSDYNEALEMGHRVIVMYRGEIVREFSRGEATEEDILRTAIGAAKN